MFLDAKDEAIQAEKTSTAAEAASTNVSQPQMVQVYLIRKHYETDSEYHRAASALKLLRETVQQRETVKGKVEQPKAKSQHLQGELALQKKIVEHK
ncbi:hypothetical protein BX616_010413 [Lobosporangium transversale]|uniref:Uncharacterized protein n=1 Tax=Lobosporangium transversale TaxID=64571 RepID=A0A1Y2GAC9_9FUNG|nr:hypothetical protein BCR41DRAFT_400516 [Lobosporangium transversale]KAF9912119.1 hypothetical protein BX616_010413 [Lobosporangium transversale]ORZ05504.1 hypothetical protein BCR41DRAFT_400516 [Lobosporangium transversale]|eukprot:XP_021877078.1 hypothetical protein BCR41DRAFT_400516 [Lobosporangium transversale]